MNDNNFAVAHCSYVHTTLVDVEYACKELQEVLPFSTRHVYNYLEDNYLGTLCLV